MRDDPKGADMTPEQAAIDRRSLVCGLATAAGAGLYMTQEQLAEYPPSINPKLIALAAAFDKEIERIFSDEDAPFNVLNKFADEFSEIVAANLNELCVKAYYADRLRASYADWDYVVAESIIRDLLAIDGKLPEPESE
jgi:hypothetical protein